MAAVAAVGFTIMALPGCGSSSETGLGCPPLSSYELDIYPYSTAAGAYQIRVSPLSGTTYASGRDTENFTITACYGPVKWSVSAPSYVSWHPRSGTLQAGQHVQVRSELTRQHTQTTFVINPGDYVIPFSYSESSSGES